MRYEIERMKEEEAARAKEEMRKRKLKERQAQEEKYARVNRLKILNQWRKLMRLVKVEDLRKEIEIISQNHERVVDRKDAIIQMLDRDLEDSEVSLPCHSRVRRAAQADACCLRLRISTRWPFARICLW